MRQWKNYGSIFFSTHSILFYSTCAKLSVSNRYIATSTNESMPLLESINEGQLGNLKAVEA